MLFSELYKIMVNKVTSVSFRGGDRPNRSPLRISHWFNQNYNFMNLLWIKIIDWQFDEIKHTAKTKQKYWATFV